MTIFIHHYLIIFIGECNLARDCVGNELCIGGICQPTCHGNTSCPEFQYCQNNICTQELRCFTNNDCESTQICKTNTIGQVITQTYIHEQTRIICFILYHSNK